jgi:hypothetical protein
MIRQSQIAFALCTAYVLGMIEAGLTGVWGWIFPFILGVVFWGVSAYFARERGAVGGFEWLLIRFAWYAPIPNCWSARIIGYVLRKRCPNVNITSVKFTRE